MFSISFLSSAYTQRATEYGSWFISTAQGVDILLGRDHLVDKIRRFASIHDKVLKQQIANFGAEADVAEVGQVLSVGDGVARVHGLDRVQAGAASRAAAPS